MAVMAVRGRKAVIFNFAATNAKSTPLQVALSLRRDPGTFVHPYCIVFECHIDETSKLLMADGDQVYKHRIARPHVHTNPAST
jgi:hypothetical protein